PVMVTAPVVVLLYYRTFLSGSFAQALRRRRWLYLGLAASWLWLFRLINYGKSITVGGANVGFQSATVSGWQYTLTQPQVILHYLRLSFWPHPLCIDYRWPAVRSFREAAPSLFIILCLLTASGWALWRRHWTGFLGAFFFLVLAPSSSLVPISDLAAERRMYLPLAAVVSLFVCATFGLWMRAERLRTWSAAALGLAGLLGALTWSRNRDYQDEIKLWQSALRVNDNNDRGHYNLAEALRKANRVPEATLQYAAALRLNPSSAWSWKAYNNLGGGLLSQGRFQEAIPNFQRALAVNPQCVSAAQNL